MLRRLVPGRLRTSALVHAGRTALIDGLWCRCVMTATRGTTSHTSFYSPDTLVGGSIGEAARTIIETVKMVSCICEGQIWPTDC
jgi:hypothetical protein